MAPRSPDEIRRELERWKSEVRRYRRLGDKRAFDGLAANITASALAWVLGEVASPTHRVKVND